MTSEYTPTEEQMLTAWLIASGATRMPARHQGRFKAEFGRGIARVQADAAVAALREAAGMAITIPDALGYTVTAVAVEDLLGRADQIEQEGL